MKRAEVNMLKEMLACEPTSPIVLLGPEGSGTSSIATAALNHCRPSLLLHINLRQLAATGQRSLLEQLVHACGYYTSPRELADLGLLSRATRTKRIDDYDMEDAFSLLTEVLRSDKRERARRAWWQSWGLSSAPRAPPVVVIDELADLTLLYVKIMGLNKTMGSQGHSDMREAISFKQKII